MTLCLHKLTESSVVVIKGESQINGSITCGAVASYVDCQSFKACNFSGNLLTKAELLLYT